MNKKDHKLREALGNLFKARGEVIESTKKPQQKHTTTTSNESKQKDKDNLNGGLNDDDKSHKTKFKKQEVKLKVKNQSNIDKKQANKNISMPTKKKTQLNGNGLPKSEEIKITKHVNNSKNSKAKQKKGAVMAQQQENMLNKTNKNTLKSTKAKNTQATIKDDTSKHPPGYFVMNHNDVKSKKNVTNQKEKPKLGTKRQQKDIRQSEKINGQKVEANVTKSQLNAKKGKANEDNEANAQPQVQAKKRKANKNNGPRSKVHKYSNDQFDSEAFSPIAATNTSIEHVKDLSRFEHPNDDSDEDSYTSFTDETDTTEDYSESYDDESFSDDYDDEFSFESDDLDDTYSEQSETDISFSDTESLHSIHDPDYELPKTVLEDHIIHKGLAVKYDFGAEHNVQFDEHNESAQIIELPNVVSSVEQHESLSVEHLRTLEVNYIEKVTISNNAISDAKNAEEPEECPELVPIDEVDFRLWTSGIEMDDEIFSECTDYVDSDEESITAAEGNINNKYLKNGNAVSDDDDSDESFNEENEENYEDDEGEYADGADVSDLTAYKQLKAMNIKADVIVTKKQHFGSLNFNMPEKNVNQQLSLAEIIAQTQDLIDSTNVVVKTAEVNDANWKKTAALEQNVILEDAEVMRACDESSLQRAQVSHQTLLQFANEDAVMDDSVNAYSPETTTAAFLDESVTNNTSTLRDESVTNNTSTQQDIKKKEYAQLQKFKTQFYDSIDSHNVLVLLKSSFYIYGTVKATLIAGSATVFGYKLEKWKTQQLYSPRGVCALQILPLSLNALESKANKEEILATIETFSNECEFHPKHLEKLLANFEPSTDAILLLTRNDEADNIKRMLQSHVKENIFPAQIPQSRQFYTTEFLLDCMINVNTEYPLQIPPQWNNLRLESNSKFLLVGGKSVGKSTLLRFLVNQHLNKFPAVLVIDLDIGQPEIFASQAVSCALVQKPLLGPGFFYGLQPDKAFCVAHSNVVLCAHRYLPAVLELLQYCNEEPRYRNIPWVINTMGYNKGFGAELIAVITEHLRPTDIVQLHSNVPINNFDFLFEPHVVPTIERNIFNRLEYAASNTTALKHRLHMLPSAVLQQGRYQREWQMSAKDMRYVMLLTQLSQILNEHSEILNQKQTYCVNMDVLKITNPLSNRSTDMEVAKSLVSNLVYLGHSDPKSTESDTIECFGIGIVRAIDWPARQLYLLTALPLDRLKRVNALTAGDMPLPASMLTLQNLATDVDVPFVQNVADEATSRAIRQFYSRT